MDANSISQEKLYKMKSLSKFGINRARDFSIYSLILAKDSFFLGPHLNLAFLFIMSCKGFTVSEKLGTSLLTIFFFLRKDCIDFLLWILEIISILSGFIIIIALETTNPRISFIYNKDRMGFKEIPYDPDFMSRKK
jgi:hypothetical protein